MQVFAAVCLVVSFIVHLATYLGINLSETFPPILLLHVGAVFVLFSSLKSKSRIKNPDAKKDRLSFGITPQPIRILMVLSFIYVILLFITGAVFQSQIGRPIRLDGMYILHSFDGDMRVFTEVDTSSDAIAVELNDVPVVERGEWFVEIPKSEYDYWHLLLYRGISACWMTIFLMGLSNFALEKSHPDAPTVEAENSP